MKIISQGWPFKESFCMWCLRRLLRLIVLIFRRLISSTISSEEKMDMWSADKYSAPQAQTEPTTSPSPAKESTS